ncbi:MAG TPA: hypothetical protein VGG76_08035 [Gemmatimonadaceae bacterium]
MQTATQPQTPTPLPTPAIAPKAPTTYSVLIGNPQQPALPVPTSRAEVRAVLERRSQLSDQLENVSSRRSEVADELAKTGADVARTGLEQRLQVMDQRILQLEGDLGRTGQQLASAAPELVTGTSVPGSQNSDDNFGSGFAAGSFSILGVVLLLFFARRRWKGSARAGSAQLGPDSGRRLERLEQGMDAIAIEIERVSEGQRFVTKLLSESHRAADNMVPVESGDPAKS